ncbi:hypothetical protein Bca4012_056087 [Brassica carinata]
MENVREGATVPTRSATIINHEPPEAHVMSPEIRSVMQRRSYQPSSSIAIQSVRLIKCTIFQVSCEANGAWKNRFLDSLSVL